MRLQGCPCGKPVLLEDYDTGIHSQCEMPLPGGPFLLAQDVPVGRRVPDVSYDWQHLYCYRCFRPAIYRGRGRWRCPDGHTECHPWMRRKERV